MTCVKKNIFFLLCLFCSFQINAQKNADIGIIAGCTYYLGDLNSSYHFSSPNFAGGILLRYTLSYRYAIRGSIFMGTLSGSDGSSKYDYQKQRNVRFDTPLTEYTMQLEFNFLEYKTTDDEHPQSLYVATGFTFFIATDTPKPYQVAIPLSIGYKFNLTKRISIGAEWTFRKTFTDYLDLVSGNDEDFLKSYEGNYNGYNFKQKGYYHNNDWYSFANVFVTYKLKEKNSTWCPAYKHYNEKK